MEAQFLNFSELGLSLVEKLQGWISQIILGLPNLLVAILVLLLFVVGAKGIRKVVLRLIGRVSENEQVNHLLGTVVYVGVVAAGTFVALGLVGLEKTVTSLLAGVGILGLALGFAFQDIASNFVSGVLLAFRRPFRVGDLIDTNGTFGTVEETNLRSTIIRTTKGQRKFVPNASVFGNTITNFSGYGKRRVDVEVGVGYDDDLQLAHQTAVQAVEALDIRDEDTKVEVFFTGFGGSSIDLVVRFWIPFTTKQAEYLSARSTAIQALKKAFDEADLNIPFPIRTLDFGDSLPALRDSFAPGDANGSA